MASILHLAQPQKLLTPSQGPLIYNAVRHQNPRVIQPLLRPRQNELIQDPRPYSN